MLLRDMFPALELHLAQKQVTVITGMRRVGKSTALQYLLGQIKHTNKRYLDCERIEIRTLLNRPDYESIVNELQLRGLDFSQPCVIALDEIQMVENLPSLVKYLYDTYAIKFIVTGSSSYYMKNRFSESLAGRKRIFEMFPLSFKEFLRFKKLTVKQIEKYGWQPYQLAWYNRCRDLYNEYLRFGGFPEVVIAGNASDKEELLKDIINSYIELDIKLLADYSASEELYKLVKLLAARTGNKIDYTKLASVTGINRQKIASYIQLLEHTYLVYLVKPHTTNIDKEISQQPKIYFADNGLLQVLAGSQISNGQFFENAIAAQLKPLGTLNYYQKKTGQEIDFIFNSDTAIEVKETPIDKDLSTLQQRAKAIGLERIFLFGHHPPNDGFENFIWGGSIF